MRLKWALLLVVALATTATAGSITTLFGSNNNFHGNMFDATVGPSDLWITGFDVNVDTGSMTLNVYTREGSYVGHETNPADWTLQSSLIISGNGKDVPTHFDVPTPFLFSAGGLYGVYVTVYDPVNEPPYMYYTNGSGTYSNADIQLDLGIGLGGPFGSMGIFNPRTWNGTIYYETSAPGGVPEPATFILMGMALLGLPVLRRRG